MSTNKERQHCVEVAIEFLEAQPMGPGGMRLDRHPPIYTQVTIEGSDLADLIARERAALAEERAKAQVEIADLKNRLELAELAAKAAGSQMLDLQQDCIRANEMLAGGRAIYNELLREMEEQTVVTNRARAEGVREGLERAARWLMAIADLKKQEQDASEVVLRIAADAIRALAKETP